MRSAGLVEIFGDRPRARHDRSRLLHIDRRGPGRIQHEELVSSVEPALLDEVGVKTAFGEDQADEAGERVEGVVVKLCH